MERLPPFAKEVASECGYLPLGLAIVGARVKRDPNGWESMLHRLRQADLEKLAQQFPDYPYSNLLKAIQVSIDGMENGDLRKRYLDFAVFPQDTRIPKAVLETLWAPLGMNRYEVQDTVARFTELSLIHLEDADYITLHDLLYDYVRNKEVRAQLAADRILKLHERLVEAYRMQCKDDWATGPNDGYYFERLPWHFKESGRTAELKQLLFTFVWLKKKLESTSTNALIADYEYLVHCFI